MTTTVLYNGKIHTQDQNFPLADAVAIQGKRILAVGRDTDVRALADSKTVEINLDGRLVLPGLTDCHFHFIDWAHSLECLELADSKSLADLRNRLAEAVKKKAKGKWILGYSWNEIRWPEPRLITRTDLDDLSPDHPVILWRSDKHLAVVNSLGLKLANITSNTPDPERGIIDRDPFGQPTGILRELAMKLVRNVIPPFTESENQLAVKNALPILHRLGLTGVHDFRMMAEDIASVFRAYQRLQEENELAIRMWMLLPGEMLDNAITMGLRTGYGNDNLRLGHVKYFSDGGQGARTAWMLEGYEDTHTFGMPITPMDELWVAIQRAQFAGLAVAIHAIGDRANRELISLFEKIKMIKTDSMPSAPHRIEHVQNIRPEDVIRLSGLGVVASVQPLHVPDDYPMVDKSVGQRARFTYPFRDMLDAGVPMACGSDCPVADPNPLWGIQAAVTRQMLNGTPAGGWYPEQRITVAEVIRGYTMGAAEVTGRQADLGSITPAKLADMVVLNRNIYKIDPLDIADVQIDMTFVGGQVVFQK